MKLIQKRTLFKKVLVPVIHGCDPKSAIIAARAVRGRGKINLLGLIPIPDDESLSTAAVQARAVRKTIQKISKAENIIRWGRVHVSHKPWSELRQIVEQEKPDLLILVWPCQFEALNTTIAEVLSHPPCDIVIVNQLIPENLKNVLIPMRGGPYAELALRLGLSIKNTHQSEVSSLHIYPTNKLKAQDAAFRGMDRVLRNLPEIKKQEVVTDDPAGLILDISKKYELLILGASARPVNDVTSIGPVAEKIMQGSKTGIMVVKTRRTPPANLESEEAGQAAISVLVDKWFAENTYHADEFNDLNYLLNSKREQGLSISLALPALDEEQTVRNVIKTLQDSLLVKAPLLDEIVLIDSNSTDRTREIATSLKVPVFIHQSVLPEYGARDGKGEALWKSLYCTRGDIVIWVDTDIVNIHPRFVYGLIGPLLLRPEIHFVKGFYRRPLKVGSKIQAGGGGRVTELSARPLLNLFYPELSGVIQPLSGEYGGRRKSLEQLPFFSGYGVEIGLLIDVFEKFGLNSIAQIDLQERIHHNQSLQALSKMSFAIIQAVMHKLEGRYNRDLLENVNKTMKIIRYEKKRFFLEVDEIAERERPPMAGIPEYQQLWKEKPK